MDFSFSEDQKVLRDNIRRFVDRELLPINEQVEREKQIPDHIIDQMKQMGLFGILTPQEYGGMGMSNVEHCIIQEELARGTLAYTLYISGNNGIGTMGIVHYGNEEQKQKYLPGMATGELLSCFALTEPNAGSDAAGIRTKAVKKGEVYVLNGMKHLTTSAAEYSVDLSVEPYGVDITLAEFVNDTDPAGDPTVVFDIYGKPDSRGWVMIRKGAHVAWIKMDGKTGRATVSRTRPIDAPLVPEPIG